MSTPLRYLAALLLASSLFYSAMALAWDGSESGKIVQAEVTSAGNYSFRLVLEGSPALCGNANTWAYVDSADANFRVYVAAALAAKAQGVTVRLYTTRDAVGYCKIGYLATYAS